MAFTDTYIIGQWTVEPVLNQLSKLDDNTEIQKVILVPKVMALLQCLVEHDGQPVHQDELMERVWPNRVVSDSSVYQAIAQLRKALEDTGTKKEYIERVSGKGYRLVVPVSQVIQKIKPHREQSTTSSVSSSPKNNIRLILTGLSILFLVIIATLIFRLEKTSYLTSQPVEHKVSVDKLTSISLLTLDSEAVTEKQLLAFNDVILSQLTHIENMKVVALNGSNESPNTDAILKGKIHQQGNDVRVFLQLENSQDREVIWAKLFEGDTFDLFALQDQIVDSLLLLFNRSQSSILFAEQSIDKHSFNQYLLARHFWEKRNVSALEEARNIYEELDDQGKLFPLAAVGLCNTYHFLYIYSDWAMANVLEKCKPLLDNALLKQPNLGQALAAQAFLLSRSSQHEQSESLFKKAIQLAPNYAFSYLWYGNYLTNLGRVDEALKLTTRAYNLAPMSPIANRSLANSYLNLHNMPEAAYYYRRSLNLEPNYTNRAAEELEFLPITVARASAFNAWLVTHDGAMTKQPSFKLKKAQVALALGNTPKANNILQAIDPQKINTSFLWYVQASYHVTLGNLKSASQLFKKRLEISPNSLKLALPYIYSLYELGEYQQAFNELLISVPALEDSDIVITQQNQYLLAFYLQLLRHKNQSFDELSQNLEQWFINEKQKNQTNESIAQIEWLLFLNDKHQAQERLTTMMNNGWLPDTNVDPFIEIKMKRLFIETGLGEQKFAQRLANNRQQALRE